MTRSLLAAVLVAPALLLAAPATAAPSAVPAAPVAAAEDATGTYYKLGQPTRFLDTRTTNTPGKARTPLKRNSPTALKVTGRAGVPTSGVSAVVVNLTAVNTTSQGYFTLYPSDMSRPTASTINFPKGWIGANMATVPVGTDGKIKVWNYGGDSHAVLDVLGWYAADDTGRDTTEAMGAQFYPVEPTRLYDSRAENDPFYSGDAVSIEVDWTDDETPGDENDQVTAYVVNITAVDATREGVFTAWSGAGSKPTASNVNYEPGIIAPNMAVVPVQRTENGATIRVDNVSSGRVHMVVDIVGVYATDRVTGMRYRKTPDAPVRILDTRSGKGLNGAFGHRAQRLLQAPASVLGSDSALLVANITGVEPTRRTYLTVWDGVETRPSTSNLNVHPGLVRAASTYAPLDLSNRTKIYNDAGSMHVVMDVVGTFEVYDGGTAALRGSSEKAVQPQQFEAGSTDVTATRD
ncbi:hypothetical protein JQN72_08300 [Phycicoccus sp. CSK15P-2]|uniref:hypothetical protein n=1 Tax=Phycicoccus sp. CSK15P-2 TaxID=2807627 RepID=UPI00194DD844|nr:hypothetical protein [Phycicoccus sp. CSK15P-2]MBM6404243.1 hypothetical protein [Phycicoccus sp. CSK15P-2]